MIQLKEWQSDGGMWHAAYTDEFKKGISNFAIVAHGCGLPADKYTEWVIKEFKPDEVFASKDYNCVFFSWKSQNAMRKYKNAINKRLREKNLT